MGKKIERKGKIILKFTSFYFRDQLIIRMEIYIPRNDGIGT